MLRVIGLMLVIVTGAAKITHAEGRFDPPSASGIATALQRSLTGAHPPGAQRQIGAGLAFAPTGQDDQGPDHLVLAQTQRQQRGPEGARLVGSRNARGHSDDWLDLGASKPSLAYSVSDSLSLGLDYHYQSTESMNYRVAEVGGLEADYRSHSLMFQARVEF